MPVPSPFVYPSSSTYPGPADPLTVDYPQGPLVLCDSLGNSVAELEVDHTIRFELSRAWSVKFSLGYDQAGASEMLTMLGSQTPRLLGYKRDTLIFSGWWQPQQETVDGSESDGIACEFRSPFAQLETRYRATAKTETGVDAAQIAWDLISDTNDVGQTGLVRGATEATVNRTRKYAIGDQVAQAITDFTDAGDFQFTETPLPASSGSLAAFNAYKSPGRDLTKTALFEYGATTLDNVVSVERTISQPVNRVIATGGTATTPVVADDLTSQGLFGVYMQAVTFSNVQDQTHLNDKATALLKSTPVEQVSFTPDVVSAPQPGADYWLGDTISFRALQDGLAITAATEVTAIEIDRDSAGIEYAHRLEFGDQVVQPLEVVQSHRRIVFRTPGRRSVGPPRSHPHHPRHHKPARVQPGPQPGPSSHPGPGKPSSGPSRK